MSEKMSEMVENNSFSFEYIFISLIATLVFAISIAYVVRKWFYPSSSDKYEERYSQKSTQLSTAVKNGDLKSNENHYSNGNTVKVIANNKHKSLNNNDSEDSEEVIEDLIIKETVISPLGAEVPNSDGYISDFDTETNGSSELNDSIDESAVNCFIEELNKENAKSVDKVTDFAAIVLTDDLSSDWYEIVCITSGSDIIEEINLEPEFVVVDCRAPVLARRCLIRYIYRKLTQLVKHEVSEEDSLFTAIPSSNRFELKKNIKLNLYLSEPPDSWKSKTRGRVNGAVNRPKRRSRRLVRLKSTTDKISLWNEVGIQGSLLSHFVDTICINSVIIPVEFNERSFHQHFIMNYTKEPKLIKCENSVIKNINQLIDRFPVNGCEHRVATNWIQLEDSLELIDCKTGKAIEMNGESNERLIISRLSKHELHKCFRQFLTIFGHSLRPNQSLPMTYRKWKETAPNYRIQKQLLKVRYAVAGRHWTELSSDIDMFV